jgi:D-3-phosphoglycerate dehydrogenase
MGRRVLITDHPFAGTEIERSVLDELDVELVRAPGRDEDTLVEAVAGCEAILVCYARLTARVVDAAAAAGCRIISRYGVGYDNIDVEAATRHGIVVTYVPDYCLDEVADHTLALLLALARDVVGAARAVAQGEWRLPPGPVRRLGGQRLAVIGAGGVGRRVIARARSFGYDVIAFDPWVEDWDLGCARADSFGDAVAEADAITLHVPLTGLTRHLINRDSIATLRRAPILVNTSRGPLVDMDAALEALAERRLSGVALDVTEVEPPARDHPLRSHPRALITPHMAYYSAEAQEELQRRAAEEVARALTGAPPRRPLNPELLPAS